MYMHSYAGERIAGPDFFYGPRIILAIFYPFIYIYIYIEREREIER